MRVQTFVIGYVLALALFLFAQHRGETAPPANFHAVVDLTNSTPANPHGKVLRQTSATTIDAPAQFAPGMWTVDEIPPERLIAPLVVLDVTRSVERDPDYRVSVEDIANWEQLNGHIPLGAIVMARTGSRGRSVAAGYSQDAAQFLIDARKVIGLGIDTSSIEGSSTRSTVRDYALAHSVYPLHNVVNLDRVPSSGAVVVVAPEKIKNAAGAPVRIFALLH